MNIYQVGGCVRDSLLGIEASDRDWVVVGATPEQMRAAGFLQVGADFPVFLHPATREEYALARTERKVAAGYHGFAVGIENVTLEEDLLRRDLTLNAMARDAEGRLIDPYGGARDIEARVLRHVSEAFAEDPVRILRVLRLLARFGPDWRIAPETEALMRTMIAHGEADALVAERVWKECSRALMEPHAQRFVQGLVDFGLTELPAFVEYRFARPQAAFALNARTAEALPLASRFAVSFAPAPATHYERAGTLPVEVRRIAQVVSRLHEMQVPGYATMAAAERLAVLQAMSAFSRNEVFAQVRAALEAMPGIGREVCRRLDADATAARAVDTRAITGSMAPGPAVGRAIEAARLAALVQRA